MTVACGGPTSASVWYSSTDPLTMFHLVLVHPDIPHNAGAAGRLALATGSTLHLVRPLGFSLDDKHVRRTGLDYWQPGGSAGVGFDGGAAAAADPAASVLVSEHQGAAIAVAGGVQAG